MRCEPDRVRAQVPGPRIEARARQVSLVEDQIEDGEHLGEPFVEVVVCWDAEGDPGRNDLALGTGDSLAHRRLRAYERACDLCCCETANGLQGERDLSIPRERWMAADEDRAKRVLRFRSGEPSRLKLAPLRAPAAQLVEGTIAGDGHQPRAWPLGNPAARPALERTHDRILDAFLHEREVASQAGERAGEETCPRAEHGGKACGDLP